MAEAHSERTPAPAEATPDPKELAALTAGAFSQAKRDVMVALNQVVDDVKGGKYAPIDFYRQATEAGACPSDAECRYIENQTRSFPED